jgi:hypothetical protein
MAVNTPKYLYRYCSADRAIQILRDKYLYLASVDQLNDLFESSVGTLLTFTPEAVQELAVKRMMALGELTRPQAEQMVASQVSEAEKRESFDFFVNKIKERNRRLRKFSGIVCFSATFNDQRMWGTYGDGHSGACIQFWDENDSSVIHRAALPVFYTDDTIVDMLLELTDEKGELAAQDMMLLFLTKSTHWEEEDEWRIVNLGEFEDDQKWRQLNFPATNIRRIFLGGRMSQAERDEIRSLAEPHDWSVMQLVYDADSGESNWQGAEQVNRADLEFWKELFSRQKS